jgi:c-di-GMP-related signal transduction protein
MDKDGNGHKLQGDLAGRHCRIMFEKVEPKNEYKPLKAMSLLTAQGIWFSRN